MAIVIIKRGTPPAERIYQVICNTCHSELEFKKEDAIVTSSPYDGECIKLACPVCFEMIYV